MDEKQAQDLAAILIARAENGKGFMICDDQECCEPYGKHYQEIQSNDNAND